MRLLCRMRWHRWSVWGTPETVRMVRVLTGALVQAWGESERSTEYVRQRQTRQCSRCGLVVYRWIDKIEGGK